MDQPIAETHHNHHRLTEGLFKITGLNQKLIDVTAFLWLAKLIYGYNVGGNIGTTLDSSLESPFYG